MQIFKRFLALLVWFSATQAMAINQAVQVNINSSDKLYDELLLPVWEEIPYDYQWLQKPISSRLSSSITVNIQSGNVNLGAHGSPLVKVSSYDKNKLLLNWQLNQMLANARVKVTFRFKKFGIKITHNEVFDVQGRGINNAQTRVGLKYNGDKFLFQMISNEGFQFQSVDVKPRDGIGEVLKWIFENIFSEQEVKRYLTNEVNKELKKWAQDQTMLRELEASVNKELGKLEDIRVRISEIATNLNMNFNQFEFDPEAMNVKLQVRFDNSNQVVHECARDAIPSSEKGMGDINFSKGLVENILHNYSVYEIWENGKLQEPLFCFGYKEFDDNGAPIGNLETIEFLNRDTTFRYWITPQTLPQLDYDAENEKVTAHMQVKIRLKGEGYPLLKTKGDGVLATIKGVFKIENIPGVGVSLVFEDFEIVELEGKLRLKLFKFSPPIPLPKKKIRRELQQLVEKELRKNHEITTLIDEQLSLTGNIILKTLTHDLTEDGHYLNFEILY